jgi:large subunit ribosomal protein L23
MTFNRQISIIKPRVTEKSTLLSDKNVFSFEVRRDATKASIIHDIKNIYKVTPLKIRVVNTPVKKVISRGKVGKRQAPKKAYVYLKKGDTINI